MVWDNWTTAMPTWWRSCDDRVASRKIPILSHLKKQLQIPLIHRALFVFILGIELTSKSIHIHHGKGSLAAAKEVILAFTVVAREETCNKLDILLNFLRKVGTEASPFTASLVDWFYKNRSLSPSPPLSEHSYPQYPKTYTPLHAASKLIIVRR